MVDSFLILIIPDYWRWLNAVYQRLIHLWAYVVKDLISSIFKSTLDSEFCSYDTRNKKTFLSIFFKASTTLHWNKCFNIYKYQSALTLLKFFRKHNVINCVLHNLFHFNIWAKLYSCQYFFAGCRLFHFSVDKYLALYLCSFSFVGINLEKPQRKCSKARFLYIALLIFH